MTDCKEESESGLELLSESMGEERLSLRFDLFLVDDGERAFSRDEVRSLNAFPSPLPGTGGDVVFPCPFRPRTSDDEVEYARCFGRGIRL